MPGVGPVAYAAPSDVMGATAYLRDPSSTINSTIMTTLLNVASRFIDEKCGRFFYNDGQYLGWVSIDSATDEITATKDFFGKIGTIAAVSAGATTLSFTSTAGVEDVISPAVNDVIFLDIGAPYESVTVSAVSGSAPTFTLTTSATKFAHAANTIATSILVQFAFYENQPFSQWLTVPGDGVTAGASNYFLWPTSPKPYIVTGNTFLAPWQGFNMPAIPVSNTTYLPTPRPGSRTVAITANWGWPGVPDLIKDMTIKLAARAWEARAAGWAVTSGDASVGTIDMSHHFDSRDEELLTSSGFVRFHF